MPTDLHRQSATASYNESTATITRMLADIQTALTAQKREIALRQVTGKGANWSEAGTAAHVAKTLTDLADQLNNRGEYAK